MKAKRILTAAALVAPVVALALYVFQPVLAFAEARFSAKADRTQISGDDSVAVKLSIRTDGGASVGKPEISAPDFDLVNEYPSTFIESYYENGRFGSRVNHEITKVLKPRKTGNLKISGIQVKVDGEVFTAPPISVQVVPGGADTPPPSGYGGSGSGLRGSAKRSGQAFVVRAEVDKTTAYKGEQLIINYYLYQRVRTSAPEATKYPQLNGFLREELAMPLARPGLADQEDVMLDGVEYRRKLMMSYAAYPLKDGKLKIDPLELRLTYFGSPQDSQGAQDPQDPNDPFSDPFFGFFRQMTPRTGVAKSETITVDVKPLPEQGKPADFSGAVGEFTVASSVNQTQIPAGETLIFTVDVEGRGNVSVIPEPKISWPEGVEVYDVRQESKPGRGGVGKKTFEYTLIPKVAGSLTLPEVAFSFFDPKTEAYVTRASAPVMVEVLPGTGLPPSAPNIPALKRGSPKATPSPQATLRGLKAFTPGAPTAQSEPVTWIGIPLSQWLAGLSVGGIGLLGLWVGSDRLRIRREARRAKHGQAKGQKLRAELRRKVALATAPGAGWQQLSEAYDAVESTVYEALDHQYSLGARAISRAELGQTLKLEKGMDPDLWNQVNALLEYAETVRFAGKAGAVSEDAARAKLPPLANETEELLQKVAPTFW